MTDDLNSRACEALGHRQDTHCMADTEDLFRQAVERLERMRSLLASQESWQTRIRLDLVLAVLDDQPIVRSGGVS